MKSACSRAVGVIALWAALFGMPAAQAARIGVLSNNYAAATAADFAARISGHTFTGIDVSTTVPTLTSLTGSFDVVLLFEDGVFANAPLVGNVVAAFAATGRPVVLGTFYDQDRSDVSNPTLASPPHGWGALESIDPNTTDGIGVRTDAAGVPNLPRTLNTATLVAHPLTTGVLALTATTGFGGGNQAKSGTTVLATWTEPNARGVADPLIAFRVSGAACVIQIGIAPDYAVGAGAGYGGFTGNFYPVWKNAFDFGATNCFGAAPPDTGIGVPTLSSGGLALTLVLLVVAAFSQRRRLVRPAR